MPESDWKILRKLRVLALERLSQRILAELCAVSAAEGRSHHERYLQVYKLIRERNQEMAAAFDDPRRSNSLRQLALMVASGWITDEELLQFSEETRTSLQGYMDIFRSNAAR